MTSLETRFAQALGAMPVIAVLRDLQPQEAAAVGEALVSAGIRLMEVPLNRPAAHKALGALTDAMGERALVGAGTVLTLQEANAAADLGARFLVSPDANPAVIEETKHLGLVSLPGAFTPTEAFTAIRAGADAIKLFPGELAGAAGVKALKAVLPAEIPLIVFGGVTTATIAAYRTAGADSFGIGGALYAPGRTPDEIVAGARTLAAALQA